MELQRDLLGYENLVSSGREFVREGCLQKLSRKGYQQRMFFLVRTSTSPFSSSVLTWYCFSSPICCSTLTELQDQVCSSEYMDNFPSTIFRWILENHQKLFDIVMYQVVDSEPRMGADFCFNIYDGKRALMVAAASQSEKNQWMDDIAETVQVQY